VARHELPPRTKLLYGVGSVAFGVKDNGFSFFLLLFYNQVLGLPETWVGLGIMLALVLDSAIDPVVGHFSDHLHSRWGRRHPFMYAAALPVAASYWLLWNPPDGLTDGQLFAYFVVIAVLVRTFITLYEIPSASLVPELTDDYHERTSILSYRFFFGWWGGLSLSVLAYTVFLQPDETHAVGVLNRDGYHLYGVTSSIVMLAAILISSIGTHSYIPKLRRPPARTHGGIRRFFGELRETLSNRSFLALFCAALFGSMGMGLTSALNIYINTYFWELDSNEISLLVVSLFVSAIVAVLVATPLSRRIGKRAGAMLTSVLALVLGSAPIVLRLAGLFPANDSSVLVPTLVVFNVVTVALFITTNILAASMIADVVEDSEVTTGRRSEGVFVAANAVAQKAVSGIGIFASSLLLGFVGFPRDAKPGQVDPAVVRQLGMVYVPVLVVIYAIALGFLSTYRISRATHEQNLRRLAGEKP
jgi:GPH family glycoside/pentoside/hexuronide:cation symporter